jgi:uncharacterized delta-60 repeat protein
MKKLPLIRRIIIASILLLQLSTLCFRSRGAAGDVDLSFDPGSGVNGTVNHVVVQPDGKVIIGGGFTTVKGLARAGIARLNADGSGDNSFNAGVAADAIALQPDGKLLVASQFLQTYCDDSGCYYFTALLVTRLYADGSPDTNFFASIDSLYADGRANIESMVVQSDGKVIIGGHFYIVNGTNMATGIARLNSNGTLDNSFAAAALDDLASFYGGVFSVALQSDGKVLVGGLFGTGNGNSIARLNSNGSLDNSFNPGTGAIGTVYSVVVQSDGKVLIGGDFTMVNGTNRNQLARLNANGSLDSSFNPNTGAGGYPLRVNSVALQSDGKVLAGGLFDNGTNNSIARLNADGSLDGSFNPGTGANQSVNSVALLSDGKVIIGGSFTMVNGTNRNRIARLNADGSLDGGFYPGRGLESPVSSLELQPDGKVLIGGGLRLNADGSSDNSYVFVPNTNTSFNPDIAVPGTDYSVGRCSAVQPDGKVLIGGYTVTTLAIDEFNNHYYSLGYFVTRVNSDGSRDTNFNIPVGGYSSGWGIPGPWSTGVGLLVLQPGGKVLMGGTFGIARLNANGTVDSSFNPGFGGSVYSMLLQPDGRVLVGSSAGLAWLNSDGSRDPCFNPTINNSYSYPFVVVLQSDGRVLVGGSFSTVNGVSRNGIARLNSNGSLDSSFDPGTGADAAVRAIALQPDGNVLIAGDFLTVNGVLRPYVARLFGDSSGPRLRLFSSTNNAVVVAWPSSSAGFTLQQNTNFSTPNWVNVATAPTTVGSENQVAISSPSGQRFFRLASIVTTPSQPPSPPAPAPQLTATAGDAQVSLSWTTLSGATDHHLQRATNYNGPYTTIAHPSTANYTDTTVVNGTTYYYIVSVVYPCGESANSFPVGVTPYVTPTVHVQSIAMSWVPQGSHYYARAVVKVVDNTGATFNGATVTGNFTGAINNAGRIGVTAASGNAIIISSSSIKNGTVTFTVGDVATGTLGYNSSANTVNSATITR